MTPLRRPRRSLVLLLTLALLTLAAPANAALPSSSPTAKHRCANKKTAKAWISFSSAFGPMTRLAADNPCKGQWLEFRFEGESESDPYGRSFFVAPGEKFHWKGSALTEWGLDGGWGGWDANEYSTTQLVAPKKACVSNYDGPSGRTTYEGLVLLGDKDIRNAPECGELLPKYSAARFAGMRCPSAGHSSSLLWKAEGKKIVKLALSNRCPEQDGVAVIATWKLNNGRTVGLWAFPEDDIDLWKSDFGPLPRQAKDGRVRIATYPIADQEDAFRSNPKNRPFYYNGYVHNDRASCTAGQKSC